MKKALSWLLIIAVLCAVLAAFGIVFHFGYQILRTIDKPQYGPVTTTDLDQYGVVYGNYNNDEPKEFIDTFFPSAIEEYFVNPEYYYRGQQWDTYACEIYLEFTIDDTDRFNDHYQSLMKHGTPQNAYFDPKCDLWIIGDTLCFVDPYILLHPKDITDYHISTAKVGTILCDREQQKFIYSAILVHDGGTATTNDLGYFFQKFNIKPDEFVEAFKLDPRL